MPEARPVWVTGAGGFLGSAVCRRLLADGLPVRPVYRSAPPPGGAASLLQPAVLGDLADGAPAVPAGDPEPRDIVHFAAAIPGPGSGEDAEALARHNRRIDAHVFRLAAAVGAGVVFASSGSVYGEGRGRRFAEDGPTSPASPYARAKLSSEAEGAERLAAAGGRFVALRISAPYGPGQRARTVARSFLTRALEGRDLSYHGSGSRMQDFVYVDDVAAAVARCLRADRSGVFNVASGEPITMRDLATTVAEVAGGKVGVVASGEPDPQEGRTALYDIDAARRVLSWAPATTLRHGLERWRDSLQSGQP